MRRIKKMHVLTPVVQASLTASVLFVLLPILGALVASLHMKDAYLAAIVGIIVATACLSFVHNNDVVLVTSYVTNFTITLLSSVLFLLYSIFRISFLHNSDAATGGIVLCLCGLATAPFIFSVTHEMSDRIKTLRKEKAAELNQYTNLTGIAVQTAETLFLSALTIYVYLR